MGSPETAERDAVRFSLVFILAMALVWWASNRERPPARPSFNPAIMSPARAATSYPAYRGYDLDCSDIAGPVIVAPGWDPHGLDADHDGVGCE